MACAVCEHCNSTIRVGEGSIYDGYSYHDRCKKCFHSQGTTDSKCRFCREESARNSAVTLKKDALQGQERSSNNALHVCSETNLHNAEVFKGVLFCSGCSRRIFKGCSAARRTKTKGKRHSNRRTKRRPRCLPDRVIELARLNSALTSESHTKKSKLSNHISKVTTVLDNPQTIKCDNLKKDSVDTAAVTDVTQELLKHIYSPTDNNSKMFASPAEPRKKSKNHRRNENKKNIYSDLRIAELGASTEIAHVALRRRSEVPVIIQSESALQKAKSNRMSFITQESETSGDHCTDSDYSKEMVKVHWMDRRFRSIMKLPYKSFKQNILTRSSLVGSLSSENEKGCIVRRFKNLFYQDVTEHHRRGLKTLYSTINRKKTPYKLGWLEIMAKIPENTGSNKYQARQKEKRCKHFRNSHSYRCMRSRVMKSAGPTSSELAVLRTKLKNLVFCDFLQNLLNFNKQFVCMMASQVRK